MSSYIASKGKSRASFAPTSIQGAGGNMYIVTYTLREPVLISPLAHSNHGQAGFEIGRAHV